MTHSTSAPKIIALPTSWDAEIGSRQYSTPNAVAIRNALLPISVVSDTGPDAMACILKCRNRHRIAPYTAPNASTAPENCPGAAQNHTSRIASHTALMAALKKNTSPGVRNVRLPNLCSAQLLIVASKMLAAMPRYAMIYPPLIVGLGAPYFSARYACGDAPYCAVKQR